MLLSLQWFLYAQQVKNSHSPPKPDWLLEIYAQFLYDKLQYKEYSARSNTGAIQIEITRGPYEPYTTFSTLDTSTSDAIFTMDTLIIINLNEDNHISKSLMPSQSWANVGILTLILWASVKAPLFSHQACMISDTFTLHNMVVHSNFIWTTHRFADHEMWIDLP